MMTLVATKLPSRQDETELQASLTVTIIVEDVNRPPVFVRVA